MKDASSKRQLLHSVVALNNSGVVYKFSVIESGS